MLALMLAATIAAAPADCAYDKAAMLALPAEKFDQDFKGGWRPLADKVECRPQAAQLLADYRSANWAKLKPGELHINYWHEGQVRALTGQTREAAPLLLAGVDPDGDDIDFTDYALGTVAFLKHDRAALLSARARLAAIPKPAWFDGSLKEAKAVLGYTPAWPVNLDVLDGLITCFDKPYAKAYECRPPKPTR